MLPKEGKVLVNSEQNSQTCLKSLSKGQKKKRFKTGGLLTQVNYSETTLLGVRNGVS